MITIEVMATSRWSCLNHPDIFCYISGEYTLQASRKYISQYVKRAYLGYFGVKPGDQHKPFAPMDLWKEKLPEIWSTNGLEGSEKPLR